MRNWKRAAWMSALGVGAGLFLAGKRPAGLAVAGVGLAILAAEYPDKFESVWKHAPEYLSRGLEMVQTVSKIAEKFAEQSQRSLEGAWDEINEHL